jgi:hypothetical protein
MSKPCGERSPGIPSLKSCVSEGTLWTDRRNVLREFPIRKRRGRNMVGRCQAVNFRMIFRTGVAIFVCCLDNEAANTMGGVSREQATSDCPGLIRKSRSSPDAS